MKYNNLRVMYRRMKLCSLIPKDIDFVVTDYFFELDKSYLYTKISTSSLDEDYNRYYKITLSNGNYFYITGNYEDEDETFDLPIKYDDDRFSMFKECISGTYLIRPNVEQTDKAFAIKTLWVNPHIRRGSDNKYYIYLTVSEALKETVNLCYRDLFWYERTDGDESYIVKDSNDFYVTIEEGSSISNEVLYYDPPTYAEITGYGIWGDSEYYDFEYEYV